jgi:hypothetical protein
MSAQEQEKGTLIRGADGFLYWITDDVLRRYKLPAEKTERAREYLDDANIKAHDDIYPAFNALGLVEHPVAQGRAVNIELLKTITKRRRPIP